MSTVEKIKSEFQRRGDDRIRVAVHEAGHLICAWAARLHDENNVMTCYVRPSNYGGGGHIKSYSGTMSFTGYAAMTAAGMMAEQFFGVKTNLQGCRTDIANLRHRISAIPMTKAEYIIDNATELELFDVLDIIDSLESEDAGMSRIIAKDILSDPRFHAALILARRVIEANQEIFEDIVRDVIYDGRQLYRESKLNAMFDYYRPERLSV